MRGTKLSHALASIELFIGLTIVWCVWMAVGYLGKYVKRWEAGAHIWRTVELQEYFAGLPYEKILDFAKGKCEIENMPVPYRQEEITCYAFMMHPKVRHGLRFIMAGLILSGLLAIGARWDILPFFTALAFVVGLVRILQGCMDIL